MNTDPFEIMKEKIMKGAHVPISHLMLLIKLCVDQNQRINGFRVFELFKACRPKANDNETQELIKVAHTQMEAGIYPKEYRLLYDLLLDYIVTRQKRSFEIKPQEIASEEKKDLPIKVQDMLLKSELQELTAHELVDVFVALSEADTILEKQDLGKLIQASKYNLTLIAIDQIIATIERIVDLHPNAFWNSLLVQFQEKKKTDMKSAELFNIE